MLLSPRVGLLFSILCCILFSGCDTGPKNIKLAIARSGEIDVVGPHSRFVSTIGPMAPNVTKFIQEPKRGVTRLIVRNTSVPANMSDNIFDINFSSTIDVRGDGVYRLNKTSRSNIWLLEIDGNSVHELSILEGPPSHTENYSGIGYVLIIFGFILLIIGIPAISAMGSGCLISIVGVFLIIIGYSLTLPA